jgi:hypothetical protein
VTLVPGAILNTVVGAGVPVPSELVPVAAATGVAAAVGPDVVGSDVAGALPTVL